MRQRSLLSIALCLGFAGAVLAQGKPNEYDFKTSDGIRIHYYVLGSRGTPVMLIHGYTGSALGNWFDNGIAQELAKNHIVVALDNRNHGKSEKPQLTGPGKAQDVVELMDHLKIQKAHIHGYSMGGGMTAQLLTMIPDRIISGAFGGSGIMEADPEWQARVPADKQGRDPVEDTLSHNLRIRHAVDNGMSREEAEKLAATPPAARPAPTAQRPALQIDLTTLEIPMLAINGEYDRPLAKTHRLWREVKDFTNVVLPGKSHLSAIVNGYMPRLYVDSLVAFINSHDPKP